MGVPSTMWIFSEIENLLAELISGAKSLISQTGGEVTALVLGSRTLIDRAFARGADRVIWLGERSEDQLVEDYVPTMAHLVSEYLPQAMLIGATRRGKAVAGRLAARLRTSTIPDCKQLNLQDGRLLAAHLVYGGAAVQTEQTVSTTTLATVGQGVFEALPYQDGRQGEVVEARFIQPAWRMAICERQPKAAATVNLTTARRVVCVGRGVAKEEDLSLIRNLAKTLEAEVGCTRPLTEGLKWLPNECYIGVSGVFIKPDLYIGIGLSGQVHHTVGITDSRVVVAINKDPNAPIFEQADYGIVGDWLTIVPVLIQALQNQD